MLYYWWNSLSWWPLTVEMEKGGVKMRPQDFREQNDVLEWINIFTDGEHSTTCPSLIYSVAFQYLVQPAAVLGILKDNVGREWEFQGWIKWILFLLKLEMSNDTIRLTKEAATRHSGRSLCLEVEEARSLWVVQRRSGLSTETGKKDVLKSEAAEVLSPHVFLPLNVTLPPWTSAQQR